MYMLFHAAKTPPDQLMSWQSRELLLTSSVTSSAPRTLLGCGSAATTPPAHGGLPSLSTDSLLRMRMQAGQNEGGKCCTKLTA